MHIFCEYLHGKILQFYLIQIFNNYEGTKCQTIVYKQKIVHFVFHKKIIVKNNNFATQKWRILRPGRIA